MKINMEFTGERFVPELHGNIELEHRHRYLVAKELVKGKAVLDIASGEGFGSAMLATVAANVTGVDISDMAVAHAQEKYQAENLSFKLGSCSSIPLDNASVDVVVSFETIEHHTDHVGMMREIKRVLRPNGILIISSPDKLEYSDKHNYRNPFHVKELYREEFEVLLSDYFSNHQLYGQRVLYGSAIFCEDAATRIESYKLSDPAGTPIAGLPNAVYLIAVASDGVLPVMSSGVFEQPLDDSEVLQPLIQAVAEQNQRIEVLDKLILNQDQQITLLNQNLAEQAILSSEFSMSNNLELARFRENEIEHQKQATIAQKNYESLARKHHITNVKLADTLNSRSWKVTAPIRLASSSIQIAMPQLRPKLATIRNFIRTATGAFKPENTALTEDAATMAIARTGRMASEKYLAAIKPHTKKIAPSNFNNIPKYSIVILQFNQSQLTINCINSIIRNTTLSNVEIVVVDNGSTEENINALDPYRHIVKILKVGINRYYGEGNNLGVEFSRGEFIILMNNDIAVTAGWLEKITSELKDDIGAIGPCFIYPDDVIQEAGGYINTDGSAEQGYKRQSIDTLPKEVFECDYVSGALMLIRKSDFLKIGGFDLCWEPAYYEDVDLCLKLRVLGLKTLCCPSVYIYHVENATSSDKSLNLGLENIVEVNKAKFLDRWQSYLLLNAKTDSIRIIDSSFNSVSTKTDFNNNKKQNVLIYSPFAMTPGGGERYILSIAAALAKTHNVMITFDHPYSKLRIQQLGEYFNLDLSQLESSTLDVALNQSYSWDLAFILGNSLSPPFSAPSKNSFYICQFPFDHKQYKNKIIPFSNEYTYICYSKFVSDFIKNSSFLINHEKIMVFCPPVEKFSGLKEKKKKIISIGRFFTGGHCKNQHILIESFKKMVNHHPQLLAEWELVLAGSTRPEPIHRKYFADCISQAKGYSIRIVPDVSSEVLTKELEDSSIYWHGAGIGIDGTQYPERVEHFGIAPLEAASAGCLVLVHNSGGPGELAKQFPNCIFSYSSTDELQKNSLRLIENDYASNNAIRDNSKEVANKYSYDNFELNLLKLIN